MSNRIMPAIAAIAALAISSVASAAPIEVDMSNFIGNWFNAVGGTNLTFTGNPGNNPQVGWGVGVPTASNQSGYNLDLAPTPAGPQVPVAIPATITEFLLPPPVSPAFEVGTFTHVNQPILSGGAITGIELNVAFDISIGGAPQGTKNFQFQFTHDETDNGDPTAGGPCPYGTPPINGIGVNLNGCADSVKISSVSTSDTFTVGGVVYTFTLLGFSTDGGTTITPQFITEESFNNVAGLYAKIQTATNQTPEPGTLVLLGLGLIGLTFARRRLH